MTKGSDETATHLKFSFEWRVPHSELLTRSFLWSDNRQQGGGLQVTKRRGEQYLQAGLNSERGPGEVVGEEGHTQTYTHTYTHIRRNGP